MNAPTALFIAAILGALAGFALSGDRAGDLTAAGLQPAHGDKITLIADEAPSNLSASSIRNRREGTNTQ